MLKSNQPAPQPDDLITVDKLPDGDISIISFGARTILDEKIAPVFGERAEPLVQEGNVIINLQGVAHLSSSTLGTLIVLQNKALKAGFKICLVNADAAIRQTLTITRLDSILPLHKTIQAAVCELCGGE